MLDAPEEIETPGVTTIEGLAEMLGIDPAATAKAMVVVRDGDVVLALVRGDHRLHEMKLAKVLQGQARPATREEITSAFGAEPGSIGAVGASVRVIADETLREGQFVGGANRTGWHLRGVQAGRDFQAEFADIREAEPGDRCPDCSDGVLRLEPAIEVGNIFKLGTRYSVPMNATYLDESGKEHPIVMGSYGIGLARIMAAAVEQFRSAPLVTVFDFGYSELSRQLSTRSRLTNLVALERSLQMGISEEITRLERNMNWLATTAAVCPFIGLFGTVLGIIEAFNGLGTAGATSLRAVGPGIAKALYATAFGLGAAIPAAIAYNYFNNGIKEMGQRLEDFSLEFLNVAERNTEG